MSFKVIDKSHLQTLHHRSKNMVIDFPSELHSIAWEIAVYFNEPYSFWVREMRHSQIYPSFIRNKFLDLKGYKAYSKKDCVRALVAYLRK